MRKNLKAARKAAGLTQQAMADKLGIHDRYYKAIESGERLGAIWMWDRLEDLLGVNQRFLREIHHDKEDSQ
ncbi:MAG: helix-turn-helix transcriptional regulator [Oscillibacter sp.]|nr:helix-turn-helix transcriptional regulator [Oscillibacter sp.]